MHAPRMIMIPISIADGLQLLLLLLLMLQTMRFSFLSKYEHRLMCVLNFWLAL